MACSGSDEIVELRLPALPPGSSSPQVSPNFLALNVAGEVPEAQACNRKTYVTPSEGSRHTNGVTPVLVRPGTEGKVRTTRAPTCRKEARMS